MWRFGGVFALFLVVAGGLLAAGVWALLTAVGVGSPSWTLRGLAIGVLLVGLMGLVALGRIARRTAAPVGALIEATRRIELGDYRVRVPERGPRELKRLARTFNGMSQRLEDVDARRRAFLADVAHELRTPLTVIQGRLEAMLDGLDPRGDEQLKHVLLQVRILDRLVDDVRIVALAETGSLPIKREDVDLAVLLNGVAADFRDEARERDVRVQLDADSDLPGIEADAARMRQLLMNLMTNALRHSSGGGTIALSAVEGPAETMSIAVGDDGAGMPPELLERAFDRFSKADDSPGVGLGLAIAKDIVEAHNGTIVAESTVGEGTVVTITLPVVSA